MADNTDWTKIKPAEIEKIILDLARQGVPREKIGLILRDQHGVPKVKLLGLKIKKVLEKNKIDSDSEKKNLSNKIEKLNKHSAKNKHDYTAIRKAVMYSAIMHKKEKLAAH